jgi:hypothetical protein
MIYVRITALGGVEREVASELRNSIEALLREELSVCKDVPVVIPPPTHDARPGQKVGISVTISGDLGNRHSETLDQCATAIGRLFAPVASTKETRGKVFVSIHNQWNGDIFGTTVPAMG